MTPRNVEYQIDSADESLSFSRRSVLREDPEMDVTPMIDITFLLLIFFLVASRMTDEAFIKLPTARNGTAVSSDTSVIITLAKGPGDNALIFKGDGAYVANKLTSNDLNDQQKELEEYIEQGLTLDSKQQVLIKAEEGVRHRDVARVARAAGEATASVMYLAVLEER
jgi:biopolymer transport protein ExbD